MLHSFNHAQFHHSRSKFLKHGFLSPFYLIVMTNHFVIGDRTENRTLVSSVRSSRPKPLDDTAI